MIKNLADNRQEITNRMKFVVDTFFDEGLKAYNEKWKTGYKKPRTINYDVNSMDLKGSTDQWPAISIVASRSTTMPVDALGVNSDIIDYNIITAVVCDEADINFSSGGARAYALILAGLLEKHLPGGAGSENNSSVYRVDQVSSTDASPRSIGKGQFFLAYSATIRVYSRAKSESDPAHFDDRTVIPASVPSNFYLTGSCTWRSNGVDIATSEPGKMAALELDSGALAGPFDLLFETNIPADSDVIVTVQRDRVFEKTDDVAFDISGTSILINNTTTPQTGDVWTVGVIVNEVNVMLTWAARITLV